MKHRLISWFLMAAVLAMPVALAIIATGQAILGFVFFYPLLMSGLWMVGGLSFFLRHERHWPWGDTAAERAVPALPGGTLVTVIIPCFNEARNGEAAILAALRQRTARVEVIAVNDGSSDATGALLERLAAEHPRLRVLHLAQNQGKAMALRMGALAARSDLLVCIDGDAVLDPDAVAFLVRPLIDHPRVGAVTGNPRVRTRSTLVGAMQVGEFSSIIGLIKRTQRVYGQVFTVSGVITAFRRQAVARVGYWSLDMVTEDIDISWKLQRDHWSIFYEPRALCWILMPETLRGLWRQRLRWAQGGAEILIKNLGTLRHWKNRRLWLLLLEFSLSALWAYSFALSILLHMLGWVMELPPQLRVQTLVPPAFTGLVLAGFCLLQFSLSILIERRYEKGFARSLAWIVWYPLVFWTLNLFTTLVSFPQIMLGKKRRRARWVSPDRGINSLDSAP